jgi:Zn-dependent peptidase ImmA (M78 family)/transcriptional regulator with XRE-family HTH domain
MKELEKVNPKMIITARESRGISISDLAGQMAVNKSTASRWENEYFEVNNEAVGILASNLKYPETFFYQKGDLLPTSLSYRKRDVVAAKLLSIIEANINISRLNIEQLLTATNFDASIKLPLLDVNKYGSPQECANQLRKVWKINKGAIDNLSEIIEAQNIFILNLEFGTERVDGRFIMALDKYPVIITNKTSLGDRQRFTLAYQLGHIVMHMGNNDYDRDLSHEANLFAAELLMPAKDIANDLHNLTLPKLGELKKKWKVSMQSLVYRANDLEIITDNQKRYLIQQFHQQGISRHEPKQFEVTNEQYKLVRDLLTNYRTKQKLSVAKMASFLHLEQEDFLNRYNS